MSTNIPKARQLIETAANRIHKGDIEFALDDLNQALSMMTRQPNKKAVRRGNKVTKAHKLEILEMQRLGMLDNMTTCEIAEAVIGDASAGGRVSEILAGER